MPRLFTGIEIPAALAEKLSVLRGGLPGARWIDPALYHLTLRFVGDVDFDVAEDIAEGLSRIGRKRFSVSVATLDALGSRQQRAIVARVAPVPALMELQAEHERLIQRLGLPADPRSFQPHVTLARLRGVREEQIAGYLSLRGGFAFEPFPVDRFVLYSSRPGSGGGPYVVEAAYPLM